MLKNLLLPQNNQSIILIMVTTKLCGKALWAKRSNEKVCNYFPYSTLWKYSTAVREVQHCTENTAHLIHVRDFSNLQKVVKAMNSRTKTKSISTLKQLKHCPAGGIK